MTSEDATGFSSLSVHPTDPPEKEYTLVLTEPELLAVQRHFYRDAGPITYENEGVLVHSFLQKLESLKSYSLTELTVLKK